MVSSKIFDNVLFVSRFTTCNLALLSLFLNHLSEWKFQNKQACLSHLYKTSAQYKDDLLEVYPDIKKLNLACVHKNTVQKLHKKYKKNEI